MKALLLTLCLLLLFQYPSYGQPVIVNPPAGSGTGDITDVYDCATGNCSNITMSDGDTLDASSVDPTAGGDGIIAPQATDCTGVNTEGSLCWDTNDDQLWVGTGLDVIQLVPGDISAVFGCTSGDCNNLTASDGDLLDLSAIDSSVTTEGLILPNATSCASATADGQLCWDSDDNLLFIGNGTTSQGASAGTLDQAFDNGKVIDGANSQANALRVGDGTDYWEFYIGATACTQTCQVGGSPASIEFEVASGNNFILSLNGTDNLTISSAGAVTLGASLEERKRVKVPLSMCEVDGAQCIHNTDVAIGDMTYRWTVSCTDNDVATITCEVPADPAWDEAQLGVIMHGAQDSVGPDGNFHADISMVCVGDNESLAGLTYGTEAANDIAASAYAEHDKITTSETTVPVTGCAAGDTVLLRYQVDATGTTTNEPTDIHWRWMEVIFNYDDWRN